jgi:hypothetical protein
MGTTRLIALVPALVVAVISQAGSNQLGACLRVSLAPLLCLAADFYVPPLLCSYPYHSSSVDSRSLCYPCIIVVGLNPTSVPRTAA